MNIKTETILKKKIKEKGLKQVYIANLVGLSETTFSKIVSGKIKPKYKVAQNIAKILDCKPDDIFFEK